MPPDGAPRHRRGHPGVSTTHGAAGVLHLAGHRHRLHVELVHHHPHVRLACSRPPFSTLSLCRPAPGASFARRVVGFLSKLRFTGRHMRRMARYDTAVSECDGGKWKYPAFSTLPAPHLSPTLKAKASADRTRPALTLPTDGVEGVLTVFPGSLTSRLTGVSVCSARECLDDAGSCPAAARASRTGFSPRCFSWLACRSPSSSGERAPLFKSLDVSLATCVSCACSPSGSSFSTTPSSLQGEYRAGGRVHTPSRVAPPVKRHQLNTRKAQLHFLTSQRDC